MDTKTVVKKSPRVAKPASTLAGRVLAERKVAAEMTAKIRRKAKALAADADRLLSRI